MIERLPEDLVNKIAAGEVVERPASVVKELVENSLDAGAATVRVEVEAGGKSAIRVSDDGCGMGREDAERALERHATSKLRQLEDLQRLATHGFRGEALPSIASVSQLLLRTRDDSGPAGTEVEVRHGRLVHVRDTGHPRGTSVEVRDLFGAVPARRKFLRSDVTEASHVAEALTLLALARPQSGFFLSSGGRSLIEAPAVDSLSARVFQVFGSAYLDDLVPVEGGSDWARVSGLVTRPDRPAGRPALRLYVNGRSVRDRALARAVVEGYRAAGAGEQRGDAILFLEVPLHLVDVNVHPAKTEVRFAEPRPVWLAVESAVREGLSTATRGRAARAQLRRSGPELELGGAGIVAERASVIGLGDAVETATRPSEALAEIEGEARSPAAPFGLEPLTVLGQHRRTYIVASDGEELSLLDQHTAHERVRFESLLERVAQRRVESQVLLTPQVLDVPPELRPVLDAHREALLELGFDVEPFGGASLRLAALPALLGGRDPGAALLVALRDLLERESTDWAVAGARERLAATLACHSAVRAGQPLALEAMRAIAADLGRTRQPSLCPHGRPTRVRIAREDVSRWFGRSGWKRQ